MPVTSTTAIYSYIYDVHIVPKEEVSVFHHAASSGNLELIRELIEVRGLSVDETNMVRTNCK